MGSFRRSKIADFQLAISQQVLKRVLRKTLGSQKWEWQRGCFDRLLRSDENLHSKWIYAQDNPVRHGFVRRSEDWPYYLDFINDEKSEDL
jgi:hypothetical protein